MSRFMNRAFQCLLIFATLAFSWLAMAGVHELGHCLSAWMSGGTVLWIELNPVGISRTALGRNPHPQYVSWGGAIGGVLLPLAAYGLTRRFADGYSYLAAFLAGACLIANGAYLGVGVFWRIGDAGDLLSHGAETWQLVLFGACTMPAGLYLWNGLGPYFGLGTAAGRVDVRAAIGIVIAVVLMLLVELLLKL
jgi:hypothetical protein